MTSIQKLLVVALCCAAVAWFAGPPGRMVVVFVILLFAPGYLIERLCRLPISSLLVRPALWIGLSLSSVSLLYEWATVAHISLTAPVLSILTMFCGVAAVWLIIWGPQLSVTNVPWLLILLTLFALTVWTRFMHVHELVLPPWVDSLHHALMIRVAAEQGQAPYVLRPYLPVEQLTYHWGYHVFGATLMNVAALPLPQELPRLMLWVGQILNALHVVTCAALATYLWRRPLAGAVAGLTVGLLSIMPAFYVSWGRYTLLTGLLVLPAAMIAARVALERPSLRAFVAGGMLLAGLNLIHFVVFVFALVWIGACWLTPGGRVDRSWRGLLPLVAMGALAFALTLPWLLLLAQRMLPGIGSSAMHVAGNEPYNAMPFGLLWASNNQLLLALGAGGGWLGCRRWRTIAVSIVIWSLLVVLLANPVWFGLPYLSFVTNEFVAITLFLPVSLLIGGGAAILDDWVSGILRGSAGHLWPTLRSAGLIVLAFWSALQFQSVVRPDTILATADDLAAIEWVAASTPLDARFVVNTYGWLGDVDRGADGGWWLLPLTGRQVSTPPVVFNYGPPEFVAAVKQQSAWLRDTQQVTPKALAAFMDSYGYTHVYATSQGPALKTDILREAPRFIEQYHNQHVSIFELVPDSPGRDP